LTGIWDIPLAVAAFLTWLASPPTSVADAAQHEAVRRALTAKSTAVASNDTLPAPRYSEVTAAAEAAAMAAKEAEAAAERRTVIPGPPPPPEQKPPEPDPEKFWRERVASAKKALADDQTQLAALELKVPLLQNQFMARDDPAQREALGLELSKALNELDRLKTKIQGSRAAMDKLQEEARRAGVPPGWLR
jgi:hypothetical protein